MGLTITTKTDAPTKLRRDLTKPNPYSKKPRKIPKRPPVNGVSKVRAYSGFSILDMEQKAHMDTLLLEDTPVKVVAKLIQDTWGLFKDVKPESLIRQLTRYRTDLIEPRQIQIAAKFSDNEHLVKMAAKINDLVARFEPVTEMERLVHVQLARVTALTIIERTSKTVMDSQTKNIALLHTMLKDLSNLHMDIGLLRKVPMKVDHSVNPEMQQQYETMRVDSQERDATLKALELLRENGMLENDQDDFSYYDNEESEGEAV